MDNNNQDIEQKQIYSPVQEQPVKKKRNIWIWILSIFFGILFIVSISINLLLILFVVGAKFTFLNEFAPQKISQSLYSEKVIEGTSIDKVLVIPINGTIVSYAKDYYLDRNVYASAEDINKLIDKAEKNDNIKGILFEVNSPGGSITACDIIYNRIKQFKHNSDKFIVSYFKTVAASGGYYISAESDTIVALPTCITGSIGVIMKSINIQELYNKIGLEDVTFKSGAKKDILSPTRKITKEEKVILQNIIDTYYNRFLNIVLSGRNLVKNDLIYTDDGNIVDGRILLADQAIKYKLIDMIGYKSDVYNLIKKITNNKDIKFVKYDRKRSIMELIQMSLNIKPAIFNKIEHSGFYYLWEIN